ncbi:MAG: hypothetical protein RLZZ111_1397 [Planctomycetota bacterium]|jgi:hypothetical protein
MMSVECRFALVVIVLFGCVSCSAAKEDKWTRARPKTHAVRGRVEMRGRPVEAAKVVFHTKLPENGQDYSAFGYTDARGMFVLQTFRDGDGAVAGKHRVTIEKLTYDSPAAPRNEGDAVPAPVEKSHLPDRYRSPDASGLTAEVTAKGANAFVFALDDPPMNK